MLENLSDNIDIRRAAMDLLARREHSMEELRLKLRRRFDDTHMLEQTLIQLAEENLQSDQRYAESFVRQRAARGYGPMRIRQEMRGKGLDRSDIDRALGAVQTDWPALALEVCRKKFGTRAPADAGEKARRARFLQYRGFDVESFRHLLDL